MISYTIKPLIQFILGIGIALAVGYRPRSTNFLDYIVVAVFLIILTFNSVGFGLITANLAKSGGAAGGLAFAFIIPQQILATFIPDFILGVQSISWLFPSHYATESIMLLFLGTPLSGSAEIFYELVIPGSVIWKNLAILVAITVVIYTIGIIIHEVNKRK
jgi:hypothetical protein